MEINPPCECWSLAEVFNSIAVWQIVDVLKTHVICIVTKINLWLVLGVVVEFSSERVLTFTVKTAKFFSIFHDHSPFSVSSLLVNSMGHAIIGQGDEVCDVLTAALLITLPWRHCNQQTYSTLCHTPFSATPYLGAWSSYRASRFLKQDKFPVGNSVKSALPQGSGAWKSSIAEGSPTYIWKIGNKSSGDRCRFTITYNSSLASGATTQWSISNAQFVKACNRCMSSRLTLPRFLL